MAEENGSFMDQLNNIKKDSIRRSSKKSQSWFRNKVKEVGKQYKKSSPSVGKIYLFGYDAKYDGELKYWDRVPLSLIIDHNSEYMLGLNFHYLSPKMRAKFLEQLTEFAAGMDEDRRISANYNALKKMNIDMIRPTIKLYIKSRVQTPLVEIQSDEWSNIIMLPVANFKGANTSTVYADSRKML